MDTSKLITVVLWATIAVVAYEAYKQVVSGSTAASSSSLLGGLLGTPIPGGTTLNAGNAAPLVQGTSAAIGNLSEYTSNSAYTGILGSTVSSELGGF